MQIRINIKMMMIKMCCPHPQIRFIHAIVCFVRICHLALTTNFSNAINILIVIWFYVHILVHFYWIYYMCAMMVLMIMINKSKNRVEGYHWYKLKWIFICRRIFWLVFDKLNTKNSCLVLYDIIHFFSVWNSTLESD